MRLICRLGWHNWTRFGPAKKTYGNLTQFRECEVCGVINSKSGFYEQASASSIQESINEGKQQATNS